ncbi:uncharacterized protein LOC125468406 [Pyrus x bretschneideri]|uniref:uncharacterized protein LOC125468406 n=1 Tax=Pyrus x bretschneideri TaxID=225117 RepID=UPI00202EBF44|nr:uncharacterized protein LOC125468406 [Pyrus x bretschneideri]
MESMPVQTPTRTADLNLGAKHQRRTSKTSCKKPKKAQGFLKGQDPAEGPTFNVNCIYRGQEYLGKASKERKMHARSSGFSWKRVQTLPTHLSLFSLWLTRFLSPLAHLTPSLTPSRSCSKPSPPPAYFHTAQAHILPFPHPKRHRFLQFPLKNNSELRVLCRIKEKESVRETKSVNGLPVDKVQRMGWILGPILRGNWVKKMGLRKWVLIGIGRRPQRYKLIRFGEVGFDWNWRKHFPIRLNRPYCQDNTFGRAFTGCSICLWWS